MLAAAPQVKRQHGLFPPGKSAISLYIEEEGVQIKASLKHNRTRGAPRGERRLLLLHQVTHVRRRSGQCKDVISKSPRGRC